MESAILYTNILKMYDVLNDRSIFNFLPFLYLLPIDNKPENKFIYNFQQYKGNFKSNVFTLGNFFLNEFTFITPYRYYLNKLILTKINTYKNTGYYTLFISFINPITLNITLYNNTVSDIKKFKLKLFSGSFNLKCFDWVTYLFMNKKDKLLKKEKDLTEKLSKIHKYNMTQINENQLNISLKNIKRMIKYSNKIIKKDIKFKNKLKEDLTKKYIDYKSQNKEN